MLAPAAVHALIVHPNPGLSAIWSRFLQREGIACRVAIGAAEATGALRADSFDAMILDVDLPEALAVADLAGFRHPDMPVIAVTGSGFFSDGTVFEFIPNARSVLPATARLPDMAALVAHYGGRHQAAARRAVARRAEPQALSG